MIRARAANSRPLMKPEIAGKGFSSTPAVIMPAKMARRPKKYNTPVPQDEGGLSGSMESGYEKSGGTAMKDFSHCMHHTVLFLHSSGNSCVLSQCGQMAFMSYSLKIGVNRRNLRTRKGEKCEGYERRRFEKCEKYEGCEGKLCAFHTFALFAPFTLSFPTFQTFQTFPTFHTGFPLSRE